MVGVDTLMNLTDLTIKANEQQTAHRNGGTLVLMMFGTLVEIANVVDELVQVLTVYEPALAEPCDQLRAFKKRWRARKYWREKAAFHYDRDTIKRGLGMLAKLTEETGDQPVLVDQFEGMTRFQFATAVAVAGLDDDGEHFETTLKSARDDTVELAKIVQQLLAKILVERGIEVQQPV